MHPFSRLIKWLEERWGTARGPALKPTWTTSSVYWCTECGLAKAGPTRWGGESWNKVPGPSYVCYRVAYSACEAGQRSVASSIMPCLYSAATQSSLGPGPPQPGSHGSLGFEWGTGTVQGRGFTVAWTHSQSLRLRARSKVFSQSVIQWKRRKGESWMII